jgi:hypothetical protein
MTEKALNWDKFRDKVLPCVPMRRRGMVLQRKKG